MRINPVTVALLAASWLHAGTRCEDLVKLALPETTITKAESGAAGAAAGPMVWSNPPWAR